MEEEGAPFILHFMDYGLVALLIILPFILPDFPSSYMSLMLDIPSGDPFSLFIFVFFMAIAFSDLALCFMIRNGLIFRGFEKKVKDIFNIAFTNGILGLGFVLEVYIWIGFVVAGGVLYFILLGLFAYFLSFY